MGVTLLPPVLLAILLSPQAIRRKLRDSLIVLCFACVPIGLWVLRNTLVAHTAANRSLNLHLAGLGHLRALAKTLINFALPGPIPAWLKLAFLSALALLFLFGLWKVYKGNPNSPGRYLQGLSLPLLSICFCAVYIAFIFVSISLFDAHTPLDDRIMLPVLVFLILAVITLVYLMSQALRNPLIWPVFVVCMSLWIGINGLRTTREAIRFHSEGSGYNSREWRASPTIRLAKAIWHPGLKIYSNADEVIDFATGIDATKIPFIWSPGSMQQNRDYDQQLEAMRRECADGRAIVVYLGGITWRNYLPDEKAMSLPQRGVPVLAKTADGTIYGLPEQIPADKASLFGLSR